MADLEAREEEMKPLSYGARQRDLDRSAIAGLSGTSNRFWRYPDHGGNLYWASRRYGIPPRDFLDFSSNINPLGPARRALRAGRRALKKAHAYPDPAAESLKEELAHWLRISPSMLVLGNGSTELIHDLVRLRSPRRVTVVSPSFTEYERAARMAGSGVSHFTLSPDEDFALDVEALVKVAADSEMVFFCNPTNPTGCLYPRERLLPLLEACRVKGSLLVVDESFMGFCSPEEIEDSSMLNMAGEGLVVISTFTKLFALAGLRGPGWLIAAPDLVMELERHAIPWRVNQMAVEMARASLRAPGYLRKTRESVRSWRGELSAGLAGLEVFRVYPSNANFLLLRSRNMRCDTGALVDGLGKRGILIRPCFDFPGLGEGFFRVAVRRPRENRRLLRAIREVLRGS